MDVCWNFDNSYAALPEMFFSRIHPVPVPAPRLIVLNELLAGDLGLDTSALKSDESVAVFAGNRVPKGAVPLAQAYAGHQFGHFTMLGDGRAILLGEQITPAGDRFDIQLKGSGRTPYSRGGDGRAALGPMLREYIISEAMHGLGIPTTRSLAVVATGEKISRETPLPGAILTRVASSHLRVGTFQYVAAREARGELKILADYALRRHHPLVDGDDPNRFLQLFKGVMERQAALVAKWQLVGFIHGVMNTDNMAISGETIDYGPCAFMDVYDPQTVFSSIDRQGRYAYENQPSIAGWNLARFAETLLPLLDDDEEKAVEMAQDAISKFSGIYRKQWLAGMRAKLGLYNEEADDEQLIRTLLNLMQRYHADYTNTFRTLTLQGPENAVLMDGTDAWIQWREEWQARLKRQGQSANEVRELMRQKNPSVIPRNHRVEEALAAATRGDLSVMERFVDVLADPFAYSPEQEDYVCPAPPSARPYRTFCGT